MWKTQVKRTGTLTWLLTAAVGILLANSAGAHCDTADGPIIPEARAALDSQDPTPILKWVNEGSEGEIRTAFTHAVAVRALSPEARQLADQYFLETLVRIHRAGEGAPYTGISDEPVEPLVAMADQALAAGTADEMIRKLSAHMAEAIGERFKRAVETKKTKDAGVQEGRDYVEAYVSYMHFVEGLHVAIASAGGHHAEAAEGAAAHQR